MGFNADKPHVAPTSRAWVFLLLGRDASTKPIHMRSLREAGARERLSATSAYGSEPKPVIDDNTTKRLPFRVASRGMTRPVSTRCNQPCGCGPSYPSVIAMSHTDRPSRSFIAATYSGDA